MFTHIMIKPHRACRFLRMLPVLLLLMHLGSGIGSAQNKKGKSGESLKNQPASLINSDIEEARDLLTGGKPLESLMIYSRIVSVDSANVPLNCEFAYVLAINGFYDAALYRIDKIWDSRYSYSEPAYFASQIYYLMGYDELAESIMNEISPDGKAPKWISPVSKMLLEKYRLKSETVFITDEAQEYFTKANRLTSHKAVLQALALFNNIIRSYPGEYLPYVGYSIALERAGMNKLAATVLEKGIAIADGKSVNSDDKAILVKRLESLKSKPSATPKTYINKVLTEASTRKTSPRLMAYAGGMISSSYTNINGRFGYFLSESGNAAVDLGIATMAGNTSYNLGMTYYQRHKIFVAGFGLTGSFTDSNAAAYLKVSVGLSFQSKNKVSSWDVFWDGMAPFSRSQVTTFGFSVGRSMYFGNRK